MNLKYEAKVTSIEISQEDVILLTKILSKCKRKKTDQMLLYHQEYQRHRMDEEFI